LEDSRKKLRSGDFLIPDRKEIVEFAKCAKVTQVLPQLSVEPVILFRMTDAAAARRHLDSVSGRIRRIGGKSVQYKDKKVFAFQGDQDTHLWFVVDGAILYWGQEASVRAALEVSSDKGTTSLAASPGFQSSVRRTRLDPSMMLVVNLPGALR
jgi:hypothetical protein